MGFHMNNDELKRGLPFVRKVAGRTGRRRRYDPRDSMIFSSRLALAHFLVGGVLGAMILISIPLFCQDDTEQ